MGLIRAITGAAGGILADQQKEFFYWDASTEPSIFTGNLGTSIPETFKNIGKRFIYGGDTGKDERIYYFITKEILGDKSDTPAPRR